MTNNDILIVQWEFENTLIHKLFGKESAFYFVSLFGAPAGVVIIFFIFVGCAVIQGLAVEMVVDWIPQLVSTFLMTSFSLFFFVTHVDLKLAQRIMTSFTPLLNLVLIVIGMLNFALTMNRFDSRWQFIIPFCLGSLFCILIDSFPRHVKKGITIPSLFLISVLNVVIVVIISLRRFPIFVDYIYDFGTIGGLSEVPITYSSRELATSAIFGNCVLCVRMLMLSIYHRHTNLLITLTVPISGITSPQDEEIFQKILTGKFDREERRRSMAVTATLATAAITTNHNDVDDEEKQ
jgi:hypothetical protein